MSKPPHVETPAEELISGLTHGVGGLAAVIGLVLLLIWASIGGDPRRIVSLGIYGSSLVLMYLASTLYHFAIDPGRKRLLRVLDHSAIYCLIAGTYTPIVLVSIRGAWGWGMFGVVWGIALLGTILKVFHTGRYEIISTLLYLVMGWMVLVAVKPLLASVPVGGLVWLSAGGVAYTAGVVFFMWDHLPFNHAIWHLFVIAGSVCHFLAIWFYVLPI